jgi:pimeloyl-ACP methyl ester carboxylesterase
MHFILPVEGRMAETASTPVQIEHRPVVARAALAFVHGFGGDTAKTWGQFPEFLMADPKLRSWGIFSLGYGSNIRLDVPGIWSKDADIDLLAQGLRTALSVPPFEQCDVIALAAHSMGGLVVQRAILNDPSLRKLLSHVFLFGTPSRGLAKAWFGALFKSQLWDMRADSAFITSLRADWDQTFAKGTTFYFRAVGGERDGFVPASSSIEPFPDAVRGVVPGNHVEIVKPDKPDDRSVLIVKQGLLAPEGGMAGAPSKLEVFDSARMAVELRKFKEAVETLLPNAEELDDAALVALALALDGLGRGSEALQVLEKYYQKNRKKRTTSLDALGVLGGRYKRQWLAGRVATDFTRAHELYAKGLEGAEAGNDHAQAYYHAINLAFLDLMAASATDGVPAKVRARAERALKHCAAAEEDHWRLATEAEAALMLKDLPKAKELYKRALDKARSERERDSMYGQAVRVAERVFGEAGVREIAALTGLQ